VYLLEYSGGKSNEIFSDKAQSGFAQLSTVGNEQAVYSVGADSEHLAVKMASDYLGEEVLVPNEYGQMMINYSGPAYSFPSVSFLDVFNGDFDASLFDGKIVMIGATAPILQDRHFTPIDQSTPMPGVEIQANAIQTILDREFLLHQGLLGFVAMVFCMVLVGVISFLYLPVLGGAAVLAFELVAFPFYAQWSFNRGVIVDLIWPVFALVFAYLATLAYRYVTEFKEKRKLKAAFSHYVSPELVNEIGNNPDALKLGGERRNITAMFLDLENFTHLSESMEPADVVSLVNRYFDALTKVIMAHGGTVDKFEGDAIMALFGAPLPCEDHGLKACVTALALREKMEELSEETGSGLKMRIGVASGDSIVGNMGSVDRFDYTAMGDTVNTASRLESGNKFYGTRILVNAAAAAAAEGALSFRRMDRVRLKGKDEAIDIYEVLGPKEGMTAEGAEVLGKWHEALEYYWNAQWDEAALRLRAVLEKMPGDGAATVYLKRIEWLRANPIEGWDGVWRFEEK